MIEREVRAQTPSLAQGGQGHGVAVAGGLDSTLPDAARPALVNAGGSLAKAAPIPPPPLGVQAVRTVPLQDPADGQFVLAALK